MNDKYKIVSVQNNFYSRIHVLTKNYLLPYVYDIKLFFYKMIFLVTYANMAERMGFEPMKDLNLYTLSKRAP
jgi:hypothetical protein